MSYRIFFDMDGTLARFHAENNYLERMYEPKERTQDGEIIFIDEETLTSEELEVIADGETEE